MKRLILLLIVMALPAVLFAQNQPGSENQNREQPSIDKGRDSQFMGTQENTMNTDPRDSGHNRQWNGHSAQDLQYPKGDGKEANNPFDQGGQPRHSFQGSRDRSRDQQWQTLGDDISRRHFGHGAEVRRLRYRDRQRGYWNERRYPRDGYQNQ